MKKTIMSTILILILGVGLPVTQVLATPKSGDQTTKENAEQGWHEALKTQVALARVKVSILEARTELWLKQNRLWRAKTSRRVPNS